MVLNVESVDEILKFDHSNESYWAVLSGGTVMQCKVVPNVESVDEIVKFDQSDESYWAVLSFLVHLNVVQLVPCTPSYFSFPNRLMLSGSYVLVCARNSKLGPFK